MSLLNENWLDWAAGCLPNPPRLLLVLELPERTVKGFALAEPFALGCSNLQLSWKTENRLACWDLNRLRRVTGALGVLGVSSCMLASSAW